MTKKHRKFKRILALLGVVVVLASLFVIPSSAWELTDIPFYNYFDMSVVPEAHESVSMSINSVNGDEGTVTLWGSFSNANQMKYIYSNHINRTLADICPDMTLGETYVLSVECVSVEDVGTGEGSGVSPMLQIGLSDGEKGEIWATGESRVCTEELLSKNVYFYIGRSFNDARYQPSEYEVTLRIWINKGEEAQDFCPYDIAKELDDTTYGKGYEAGFREGNKFNYITREGTTFEVTRYDSDTGARYTTVNGDLSYTYDGVTFSTKNLTKYTQPVGAFASPYYCSVTKIALRIQLAKDFYASSTPLLLKYSPNPNTFLTVIYTEDGTTMKEKTINLFGRDNGDPEDIGYKERIASLSWYDDLKLSDSCLIKEICISSAPLQDDLGNVVNSYFYICLADVESPLFQAGQSVGFETGKDIGLKEGFANGEKKGFEEGYAKGEGIGFVNGEEKGYKDGREKGEEIGYENGKHDGYYQGRADEASEGTFFTLIFDVIDAPVKVLSKVLNFEILGVDMLGLASSLLTFAILVTVVKFFV